jgi:hypothetical protein
MGGIWECHFFGSLHTAAVCVIKSPGGSTVVAVLLLVLLLPMWIRRHLGDMDALEELLGEQARECWSLPEHITNYVTTTRSSNDVDGAVDKSTTSIPSTSSSPPPPPASDVSADSTTPPPEGVILPTDKRSANSIRGNARHNYCSFLMLLQWNCRI